MSLNLRMLRSLLKAVGPSARVPGRKSSFDVSDRSLQELQQAYRSMDEQGRQHALLFLASEVGIDRPAAAALMERYRTALSRLQQPQQQREHGVDGQQVKPAGVAASTARDVEAGPPAAVSEGLVSCMKAEAALRNALTPLSARLFELINTQPGGLKLLVDIRKDLHRYLSTLPPSAATAVALRGMDEVLRERFALWLSPATLELRRITWDDAASLLEKIVDYEAVHPVRSIYDLRRRLGSGRRCFAFFHPAIPDEPLVFIEVALTTDIASSIDTLLSESAAVEEDEEAMRVAIFYSISNTQEGLRGIDLGNFLIKRVVKLLQQELPNIQTFATLSPIPGFAKWLTSKLAIQLGASTRSSPSATTPASPPPTPPTTATATAAATPPHTTASVQPEAARQQTTAAAGRAASALEQERLLLPQEEKAINHFFRHLHREAQAHTDGGNGDGGSNDSISSSRSSGNDGSSQVVPESHSNGSSSGGGSGNSDACALLLDLLHRRFARADCHTDQLSDAAMRSILMRLCARYLVMEKKRGHALDPVANFHIRNGASVHRLNWMANGSKQGLASSFGIMVNYLYQLDKLEANHSAYVRAGKVPYSDAVKQLLLPTTAAVHGRL